MSKITNMLGRVGVALIVIFVVLAIFGAIGSLFNRNQPQISSQASYNMSQTAFVNECAKTATQKYSQTLQADGLTAEGYCGCAFSQLDTYYKNQGNPQWYNNDALIARITSSGYNSDEINAIQNCLNTPTQ